MPVPPPLRPDPPRLLFVADAGSDADAARLAGLVDALAQPGVEFVRTAVSGLPAKARAVGAIVLDGPAAGQLDDSDIAAVQQAVAQGASLLVLVTPSTRLDGLLGEWLGVGCHEDHPLGEWFAKVAPGASCALAARLAPEFAIIDRPVCLEVARGDGVAVIEVSIAFSDRPVVVERRFGEGGMVVCGLANDAAALGRPELVTLLRRALTPRAELTRRSREIGLAVVGYGPYGGMGLYHGLAAAAIPGLEMVAACDFDPGRRKAAEEELPGVRPYASVAELVSDDDVEVAVVATPPSTHFQLATELLETGHHVALEKPMCLTVAEADSLVCLARSNGLALTVHQSRRWDPDYLAVRRALDAGLVGNLFNVETFVGGFEHPCRAWHSEVTVSGGAVYDWGSHHLDWILQILGDFPARLQAHGHKRVWHDITNLDQVRVRLSWADGREAEFFQSDVAAIRRPKFFLQGTRGTIAGHYRPLRNERVEPGVGYVAELLHHAEAPVDLTLARYEPGYGITETALPPVPADRYGFHRNLADHLIFGEPLAVTPESAREVVALLEAAQRSTDEGGATIELERPVA
jgi:predicted dehydrogenase